MRQIQDYGSATSPNITEDLLLLQQDSQNSDPYATITITALLNAGVTIIDGRIAPAAQAGNTSDKWPLSKIQIPGFSALTFSPTLTWDVNTNPRATLSLTGSITSLTVSNAVDGNVYILRITQDGTGSRTISFPSSWEWKGGSPPNLSTGANAVDILTLLQMGSATVAAILLDVS